MLLVGVWELHELVRVEGIVAVSVDEVLMSVTSDPSRKVHVLLHHCHSVGVEAAQIRVLEQSNDVGLGSLLQRDQSLRLEAELVVDARADGANELLEGSPRNQIRNISLVLPDLSERNCARLEASLDFLDFSWLLLEGLRNGFG